MRGIVPRWLDAIVLAILFSSARGSVGKDAIYEIIPKNFEGNNVFLKFITGYLKYNVAPKTAYFVYENPGDFSYNVVNEEGIAHVVFNKFVGQRLEPSKFDYPGAFFFINHPFEKTVALMQGIRFDRVIIGCKNCNELEIFFEACIKFDMIYAIGICREKDLLKTYTFEPFDGVWCKQPARLVLLAEFNTVTGHLTLHHSASRTKYPDYKGCPIKISMIYRPPAVLYDRGLEGYDITLVNESLSGLNASLEYEIIFEEIHPNISLRVDLHSNTQILGGMMADVSPGYEGEQFIMCGSLSSFAMASPVLRRRISLAEVFKGIGSTFPGNVWFMAGCAAVFSVLLFYLAENLRGRFSVADTFYLAFFGHSKISKKMAFTSKLHFPFWLFFVFFSISFFSAFLKSHRTIGKEKPAVKDLYDVRRQNLKIVIWYKTYEKYLKSLIMQDPDLSPLADKLIFIDNTNGIPKALTRVSLREDVVVVDRKESLEYYMTSLDYYDLSRIYLNERLSRKTGTAFYVRRQAPFLETFKKKCMGMTEAGLSSKFRRDYMTSIRKKIFENSAQNEQRKGGTALTVADVASSFAILLMGHILASFVLLLELAWAYLERNWNLRQ